MQDQRQAGGSQQGKKKEAKEKDRRRDKTSGSVLSAFWIRVLCFVRLIARAFRVEWRRRRDDGELRGRTAPFAPPPPPPPEGLPQWTLVCGWLVGVWAKKQRKKSHFARYDSFMMEKFPVATRNGGRLLSCQERVRTGRLVRAH
ncbi:hypothetical protein EUGRSUZ_A01012 [Eucalyptus grandis]|uniref:Uncharacterized protein n=2 Tax=Eucalyptus grandis TaxID=71139 RepID=A0ACC3M3A8_EUCGR|nr:hypothetical protein EUGRSUZ_A01012 [Eucalyptus grandis]